MEARDTETKAKAKDMEAKDMETKARAEEKVMEKVIGKVGAKAVGAIGRARAQEPHGWNVGHATLAVLLATLPEIARTRNA